jgi:hypothetical protein
MAGQSGPSTGGLNRFLAHIRWMSEPQYEIFEATDGTFAVEIRGGTAVTPP